MLRITGSIRPIIPIRNSTLGRRAARCYLLICTREAPLCWRVMCRDGTVSFCTCLLLPYCSKHLRTYACSTSSIANTLTGAVRCLTAAICMKHSVRSGILLKSGRLLSWNSRHLNNLVPAQRLWTHGIVKKPRKMRMLSQMNKVGRLTDCPPSLLKDIFLFSSRRAVTFISSVHKPIRVSQSEVSKSSPMGEGGLK